jgi:hypothetical protein
MKNAEERKCRDICCPSDKLFDIDSAVSLMLSLKEREGEKVGERRNMELSVHEVIMNQSILPGVGNIIKCEGLFLSKINPNESIEYMSESEIRNLILNLRSFSLSWLDACRKNNGNIFKNIYGRNTCSSCNTRVTLIRNGNMQRITYYCPSCQRKTCEKKSLMSVNTHVNDDVSSRKRLLSDSSFAFDNESIASNKKYAIATKSNIDYNGNFFSSANASAIDNDINTSQSHCSLFDDAKLSKSIMTTVPSKIDSNLSAITPMKSSNANIEIMDLFPSYMCLCKLSASLQRVRKAGNNHDRVFFACGNKNRFKQCKFFSWADIRFPPCVCKIKSVSIIRRVLKPGSNNGRYFFCCGKEKENQCGYFNWTTNVSISNRSSKSAPCATEPAVKIINYQIPDSLPIPL